MAVEIITSSIAAVAAIVCALITSTVSRRQDEAAKDAKSYRQQREKLDVAKTKVLLSTMEGVTVLLQQAKGEKLNGNVQCALDDIREAGGELETLRSQIVSSI